ncbi:hypothetical protein ACF1CG_11505 [Streptomyces sp. NPDC014773]|uniref:hypothetical protein n=1 Tax=Streptomyces sp. NPDC014773 TaxID=3364908 RepID=UPI0036FBA54E
MGQLISMRLVRRWQMAGMPVAGVPVAGVPVCRPHRPPEIPDPGQVRDHRAHLGNASARRS